jgi:hypothetical protein
MPVPRGEGPLSVGQRAARLIEDGLPARSRGKAFLPVQGHRLALGGQPGRCPFLIGNRLSAAARSLRVYDARAHPGAEQTRSSFTGAAPGVLCKGARMADNLPWVLQLLEADRKLKRFQEVLAVIAGLEPQLNAMDPDRALAVLRAVTRAARVALENADMRREES